VRIEFTYARPPEYFSEAVRPAARRARDVALGVQAIGVVAAVILGLVLGGTTGLLVVVAVVAIAAWRARNAWLRYVAALEVPPEYSTPRHYLLTDESLSTDTDLTSSTWTWDAVRYASVLPQAFVLAQAAGPVFDVPRAPLTAEQDAELLQEIRTRGLGPRRGHSGVRRH
jgi:hypothetical protein